MKKNYLIIAVVLSSVVVGTSCKKGCTDPLASNYDSSAKKSDESCVYDEPDAAAEPEPYAPSFSGTYAGLVGIKTVTSTSTGVGTIDTEIGTAVAFFSENGGSNFLNAGTVSVNSNDLEIQSNNSYVFTPSASQPTGISLGGTLSWEGTGSSWPAFTGSTTQDFSTVGALSSSDITSGSSYTLSCASVTSADSVYFGIYGPDGSAYHIAAPGTTSHTFTSSEVNSIGTGQGFIQIVGINYDLQSIASRDYWFINETVRSEMIDIE